VAFRLILQRVICRPEGSDLKKHLFPESV
jgi:hypothetical protein